MTPGNRVPEADVIAALEACGCASAPADFLRRAGIVTGLANVVELANRDRVVVFPHRTLREFLAAGALVRELRNDGFDSERVRYVLDAAGEDPATWAEVLALTAGLLSRPEPAARPVLWWRRLKGEQAPAAAPTLLDRLVREAASRRRPLAFRIVVDARGLSAETLLEVLEVDPSRGDDDAHLGEVGWVHGNSRGHTHPVGEKPASAWGLHDVHGNVWEWCHDEWHGNYEHLEDGRRYDPGNPLPPGDPRADRVYRGGSWGFDARYARSAYRVRWLPGGRDDNRGFRLLLPPRSPSR